MPEQKQKWFQRTDVIIALITLITTVLGSIIQKLDFDFSKSNSIKILDEQERTIANKQSGKLSRKTVDLSFVCSSYKTPEGLVLPTTIIRSSSKPDVAMFFWKDTSWGRKWTPIERCQEISRRLQIFYNRNELKYITIGELNNYPVLCISKEIEARCNNEHLLITLNLGENASQILQEIISFKESGGVAITRSDNSYIDVLEYWRTTLPINSNLSPRF